MGAQSSCTLMTKEPSPLVVSTYVRGRDEATVSGVGGAVHPAMAWVSRKMDQKNADADADVRTSNLTR